MKLVVDTFLSLDGVMQAPGDSKEDTEGGFQYGGWQMPYIDEEAGKIVTENIAATDALLLGRITYQIFAGYWPTAPADDPIGQRLNSIPKYVVSTTLTKVDWNNSTLLQGNLAQEVATLKKQRGSGRMSVTGSGRLAQALMRENLVDEYVLWVHPIVLGSGKRLFGDHTGPFNLRLTDTMTTGTGIVILTYRPAGS